MKMVMKKAIIIILMLAMILSLAACGKNAAIQDALQGTWSAKWTFLDKNIYRYYTFSGKEYTTGGTAVMGELSPETGRYEIHDSVIHFIPDDGSDSKDLEYFCDEDTGTFTLWWSEQIQLKKEKTA